MTPEDEAAKVRQALREGALGEALARIEELERFARYVRDGYDCDSDGHRYNTNCRCCSADRVLRGAEWPGQLEKL